ncbi:PrpR N-terminal domain-containing protein [Paenibacillus puerhi]|uniref:PrpR N-terminal domain-containing protein n=1 Tax=Paenibacillus puerhi TaxID=2692622 RepID=UPI001359D947|nr:PrpR N-terminal domain-containing protein [Paenibacillus puerhi]
MIQALLIAPYKGLLELTSHLKPELHDFQVTMVQADLSEVLPMLGKIESGGYDVIISRGGTARLLRRHTQVPVVEIPISGYDIIRILTLLKDCGVRVEMIGFRSVIEGFMAVSGILSIDIHYTVISDESEVDRALAEAQAAGTGIVVGDAVTLRKAREHGLEGMLITSGRESLLDAFAQARQVRAIAQRFRRTCAMYEELLDTVEEGFAVLDGQARLHYANASFRRLYGLEGQDLDPDAWTSRHPWMTEVAKCLSQGIIFDEAMPIRDVSPPRALYAGPLAAEGGQDLYFLRTGVRGGRREEASVRMTAVSGMFPSPWLPAHAAFGDAQPANVLGARERLALCGEPGTGKRLWTEAACQADGRTGLLLELRLQKPGEQSLKRLRQMALLADESTTLLLSGLAGLEAAHQRTIAAMLGETSAACVLAFEQEPSLLAEEGRLEPVLYELFGERVIRLQPLRERREELEGLIRMLITKANEATGRQIVGMQPEVHEALKGYSWPRNLLELAETVEAFVTQAEGDYIDGKALAQLGLEGRAGRGSEYGEKQPGTGHVNLNQTLKDIERDVIMAVLEEEQMNQSKAAKRLGINRATLWRKLKQNDL